jgi:hypothetical protein
MLNGLQQLVSSARGWLSSSSKSKELKISSPALKTGLGLSLSTAGMTEQSAKELTLQQQQTGVGQVRLNLFNNLRNSAELQSAPTGAATMSTTTTTNIFQELAQLLASQALPPVLTLMNTTLADIEANPQEWVNPAVATIKGTQFLTNLVATLPAIENAAVPGAAQLFQAVLNTLASKLTAASATLTPTAVGSEIGNTIVTTS